MPTNYYGNAPGAQQANAFNQQQYTNTLAGYNTALQGAEARGAGVVNDYSKMMDLAQNSNTYQKYLIGQQGYVANQNALAGAIRSGMGNSSYLNDLQNQANTNMYQNQMQLNDQLTQQRLGIMGQRAGYRDSLNQQLTGIQGGLANYMGGYGSTLANVGPQELYPGLFTPQALSQFQGASGGGGGGQVAPTQSMALPGTMGGPTAGTAMPQSGLTGGNYFGGGYGAMPYGMTQYQSSYTYPQSSGGGYAADYGVGGGDSGGSGFNRGGSVPGRGNSDTVPARLTPGEFVLSKPMIAKIHSGDMTITDLKKMLKKGDQDKDDEGYHCGGMAYGYGGFVRNPQDPFSFLGGIQDERAVIGPNTALKYGR